MIKIYLARIKTSINALLTPPHLEDAEENWRTWTLYIFLLITPLVSNTVAFVLLHGGASSSLPTALFGVKNIIVIISLILIRRRKLLASAFTFLISLWVLVTFIAFYLHGEMSNPALGAYLLIILGAGLFLGLRAAGAFTALSWLSITTIFIADYFGLPLESRFALNNQRIYLLQSLIFVLGLALIYIAVLSTHKAINRSIQHEQQLKVKNEQLEDVLSTLEQQISERTAEISQQKKYFETVVVNSPIAIVTLDKQHNILSCNPAFENVFGYAQDDVIGVELDTLITTQATINEATVLTHKVLHGETVKSTGQRRKYDGTLVDVEIYGVPVLVDNQHIGVLAMYNDISERIRSEQHLKHLATHDPLTMLPNRSLLYEHLDQALLRAKRNESRLGVFFLDLDGFKTVNDMLGHVKGDELLQEVASRFNFALRRSDVVARFGGDEFAFVCENLTHPQDAAIIANKILEALIKPFLKDDHEIFISGSIGISLYPEDGSEARDLLRFADTAMYRVKGQGKQNFQFYSLTQSLFEDFFPNMA